MPSPSVEVERLAEVWRLALADRPHHGPAGERLGQGGGASLEFQDRRAYVVGDDLRHLDWAAYARTDQLMVRLYREEVQPRVELFVDASRSMAVDEGKAQLTVDMVGLLGRCARVDGLAPTCVVLGEAAEALPWDLVERRGLELDARRPLVEGLQAALHLARPGAIRILISDFLSPHDPAAVLRPLAARAGGLALVQVLGRQDAEPPVGEALRLEDVETGGVLDLVLDRGTVERYRARLRNLQEALAQEAQRAGGRFAALTAGPALSEQCRTHLAQGGILTPA